LSIKAVRSYTVVFSIFLFISDVAQHWTACLTRFIDRI